MQQLIDQLKRELKEDYFDNGHYEAKETFLKRLETSLSQYIEVRTAETGKKDLISYMSYGHILELERDFTEQALLIKLSSQEDEVLHHNSDGAGWFCTTYFRQL